MDSLTQSNSECLNNDDEAEHILAFSLKEDDKTLLMIDDPHLKPSMINNNK
jgi:hypothetical protein